MAHQADKFYADTPHGGGWLLYDAMMLAPAFSANLVLTRNALGDYSLNRTAGGAETYTPVASIGQSLHRLIEAQTLQQAGQGPYTSAAGYVGDGTVGPIPLPGFPPLTATALGTIPTTWPAKGIQITDVAACYLVTTQALTAASLSLNQTVFGNNLANVITNFPIAATALPLATQANPYVVTRAVVTPTFNVTDLSEMTVELSLTMQNLGLLRVYWIGVHVNFNFD